VPHSRNSRDVKTVIKFLHGSVVGKISEQYDFYEIVNEHMMDGSGQVLNPCHGVMCTWVREPDN